MSYVNTLFDLGSHENPLTLDLELRNYDVLLAYSNDIKNDQNIKTFDCTVDIVL